MQCPVDGTELKIADRQGIEIDYCPKCRGVWLDRGELDKIIERAAALDAPPAMSAPRHDEPRHDDRRYDDDRYEDDRGYGGRYEKKKKKSMLDDLFDFF